MEATEILIPIGWEPRIPEVPNGALLRIVDVEGQQVADFISIIENKPEEWLSATHTRSSLLRLNLKVADRLQTNWRRDIYEVVADDVGMHDLITSMCDSRRYTIDYGVEGHRPCRTNSTKSVAPWRYEVADPCRPQHLSERSDLRGPYVRNEDVPDQQARGASL